MKEDETMTILLLLNARPAWLSLSRKERAAFMEQKIQPIFARYAGHCRIRLFDSEYFHKGVSDFIVIEATSLQYYRFLIEQLRDTEIYAVPYFDIVDIIPGRENGFKEYDEVAGG